jgi:hypothetical protein
VSFMIPCVYYDGYSEGWEEEGLLVFMKDDSICSGRGSSQNWIVSELGAYLLCEAENLFMSVDIVMVHVFSVVNVTAP